MIYDISVPLNDKTPIFPGDPPFKRELSASMEKGDPCNVSRLIFGAHTGTHVDAPWHMLPSGETVPSLSLEALVGPAMVVEITDSKKIGRKELEGKKIPEAARVLFKTRNSSFWKDGKFHRDFVYLDSEACEFLLQKKVQLVGTDALSIEQFGSEAFPVHKALLENKVVIVEGLNLSLVSAGFYVLLCAPLLVSGSDGAPARVFLASDDTASRWIMSK